MRTPIAVLLTLVAIAPISAQQPSTKLTLDQYLEWETVQAPRLSPDGKQIIYGRRWVDKINDDWVTSLWIMNADGSRNRALLTGGNVEWSPDGTRIAYVARGEPSGSQIFVRWMDAEGATSQITRVSQSPSNLQWSPDGKSIAFSTNRDGNDEVYVMAADGTGPRNVSNHPSLDVPVAWSADGTELLFASNRDRTGRDLYRMKLDGSGVTRVIATKP